MPERPLPAAASSSDPGAAARPELRALADLLAYPLVRRRGLAGVALGALRRVVGSLARSWLHVQTRFNQATVAQLESLRAEVGRLQADRLELRNAAALEALRDGLIDQIRELASQEAAGLEALRADVVRYLEPLERTSVAALASRVPHLEARLAAQERRAAWLLEEIRNGAPRTDRKAPRLSARWESAALDALYARLEDELRGPRGVIKDRARVYLPVMAEARAGVDGDAVLDLGCGRGEWLELLREEGRTGRGVDHNRFFVEDCQRRGLDVVAADVQAHLASVPDESLGAVTALHLVEHLPFETLLEFLDEAHRVLRPGGVAIFETPNPENVVVSAHDFHLDPTHRKPIPSRLLAGLLDARGFSRVDVLKLHPAPEGAKIEESQHEVARRFNAYFYGPRDYAVLAWKARSRE
jgi:SAM-dependent methyltransferase